MIPGHAYRCSPPRRLELKQLAFYSFNLIVSYDYLHFLIFLISAFKVYLNWLWKQELKTLKHFLTSGLPVVFFWLACCYHNSKAFFSTQLLLTQKPSSLLILEASSFIEYPISFHFLSPADANLKPQQVILDKDAVQRHKLQQQAKVVGDHHTSQCHSSPSPVKYLGQWQVLDTEVQCNTDKSSNDCRTEVGPPPLQTPEMDDGMKAWVVTAVRHWHS